MSTNATIAVVHTDGSVSQIYTHWDGYPSHMGKLLLNHYNSLERAESLVSFGDLSSLGSMNIPEPGSSHSFEVPDADMTVYYGRDRGESGTEPKQFQNIQEFLDNGDSQQYNYLFINDRWEIAAGDINLTQDDAYVELTEKIINED